MSDAANGFCPTDGVIATPTLHEGYPAVLLTGHPDTLAEFVEELRDVDTDLDRRSGSRICRAWPAWSAMTPEDLRDALRAASDLSQIDLVIEAADDTMRCRRGTAAGVVA